MLLTAAISVLVAWVAGFALTALMRRVAFRLGLVDRPDGHRKLHTRPVALGGGIAVFLSTSAVLGLLLVVPTALRDRLYRNVPELPILLLGGLVVVVVGMVDDRVKLRGRYKLLGQLAAAGIMIAGGIVIDDISLFGWYFDLGPLAIPFTLFWLIGAINAVNLLDGIDGFATTVGIILCIAVAVMAILLGRPPEIALVGAIFAASLAGFLRFNWPPATVFLGDAGSMLIGLTVGALSIEGSLKGPGTVLLAAPVAVWTIPILDCLAAIIRRSLTGRSIYTTDRAHLHHRLLDRLGSNRMVLVVVGLSCILTSGAALLGVFLVNDLLAVVVAVVVVVVFLVTGIFGRAEFQLVGMRLRKVGRNLLPFVDANSEKTHGTCIRFQGSRAWAELWETFTDSASGLDLNELHLEISYPVAGEECHAVWEKPPHVEPDRCWQLKIPLVVGEEQIGSLRVVGPRNGDFPGDGMQKLLVILDPFQKEVSALIEEAPAGSRDGFRPQVRRRADPPLATNGDAATLVDAFCVDLEEWFHVCGVETPYQDPRTWETAPALVEKHTDVLLALLHDAGVKATFLTLGWLAEKYPRLIRRVSDLGHEIGCHGYYHRLVFEQNPDQFRDEVARSRAILQDISGQAVTCFRAPGFSITKECLWAYPILAEEGYRIDVSIVPAPRDHGGIAGFEPGMFRLGTELGELTIFPVSVMRLAGTKVQFSGGGYLRLFPMSIIRYGFAQNHRRQRPVMSYIHPREIDPGQPHLDLPYLKRFKYYVGRGRCESKLRRLLGEYRFGTVSEAVDSYAEPLPKYFLSADATELTSTAPLGWEAEPVSQPTLSAE